MITHDTGQMAEQERRDLQAKRAQETARDSRWPDREDDGVWMIALGALAIIIFLIMLNPGLEWLGNGAPDNRPEAARAK